jgi:hypothetical protein
MVDDAQIGSAGKLPPNSFALLHGPFRELLTQLSHSDDDVKDGVRFPQS